jgi:hypothetical protein
MLDSAQWNHLSGIFPHDVRKQLTDIWHHLNGEHSIFVLLLVVDLNDLPGWPDSSPGLYKLKKQFIISTLSNGNVRLLVDMASVFIA